LYKNQNLRRTIWAVEFQLSKFGRNFNQNRNFMSKSEVKISNIGAKFKL